VLVLLPGKTPVRGLQKGHGLNSNLTVIESDSVVISMMRANSALAGAVTVSQTKKIMDVAHAAEIYAKRQKLSDEAVNQATSVKVEAMRKLGEILQATPRNTAFLGGTKKVPTRTQAPTLDELGLTKKESAVAQKLASLSEKAFEQVRDGSVTIAKAIAAVDATKPPEPSKSKPKPEVVTAKPALSIVPAVVVKPEDAYTELDAARDQVEDLQAMLAVANTAPEDKDQAKILIAELRDEIKTLRAMNKALTSSRDSFQNKAAELQKQVNRQRREIDRATGSKTA
jgi:hypothetical protein